MCLPKLLGKCFVWALKTKHRKGKKNLCSMVSSKNIFKKSKNSNILGSLVSFYKKIIHNPRISIFDSQRQKWPRASCFCIVSFNDKTQCWFIFVWGSEPQKGKMFENLQGKPLLVWNLKLCRKFHMFLVFSRFRDCHKFQILYIWKLNTFRY